VEVYKFVLIELLKGIKGSHTNAETDVPFFCRNWYSEVWRVRILGLIFSWLSFGLLIWLLA
jgi:hypothetical protein